VRGELTLMTIIGVLTYIGLSLLGIPYALPLAILAGFLEIIPGIGPILSAIPGILLGLTISPVMAIAAAALYFLIQQIENTVIVPKVMQKATGINPLVTMISLAVGFKMAGVLGAILAVPIVIVLHVFVVEILSWKRIK
jgi:predicted PurR-regulated permease PerM